MGCHTMLDGITTHTLSNGLRLICCRKTTAPVVAVQIWYKTGSAHEKDGRRGISHVLEHMMFRGSSHVASEEHARRINDAGGHCNAFTAEDVCAYLNSVPRRHLDMVLELEADRMAGLSLDPAILETERRVIVEEYHTYMNNPVAKAFLQFRSAFYGQHPYAASPLGNLADIKAVTVDSCRQYFNARYTPSNAVAVVVGDFESDGHVFERMEKHFGAIPAVAPVAEGAMMAATPGNGQPQWMKRVVEFDVPMLITGYPAPASASPDALPLDILQMIVSQGESSRLHREVVRRKSVAVMAGGMNHFLKHSGMSLFFAAFTPDVSVRKVGEAMEAELMTAREKGVSRQEMKKMWNTTLTNRAFEMYSAENICQRLGYAETVEGDFHQWVRRLEALEKLSREQLVDAARRYWAEGAGRTLYLKPRKAKPLLFFMGLVRRMLPKKR